MKRDKAFGYVLSIAICLMVWEVASILVDSTMLPSPESTFEALQDSIQTSFFWESFGISAYRVGISIALAWSLAFPLGVLIGYYRKLDKGLTPLIFLTYPIPKMVFLPVIILLFGLGDLSKIILITAIVFFQILVATKEAVNGVDIKYIDSMRSMGATDKDIIRDAIIPAALPNSFTALRIVTGTAISVLFFAESFAGSSGLGYMIMNAWNWLDYQQIYVGILAMSIMGIVLYEVFTLMESRLCKWKQVPQGAEPEVSVTNKIISYGQMIKMSHTVFALPFGLAALVVLAQDYEITFHIVFWVVMAIVGARSAAMGFNRVADAAIDKKNPRTEMRHIPTGALSLREGILFVIASCALFIISAAMLSELCLLLSFPVLAVLLGYSYTKRFTSASHVILGISIGLMPLGASVAVAGTVTTGMAVLGLALVTYIAGFDILYACLDIEFDKREGLYSIPSRFGVKKALAVSLALHIISIVCLFSLYWLLALSPAFLIVAGIISFLFLYEHTLVRPDDLSKVDIAFFNVNSIISLLVLAAIALGVYVA